MGTHICQYYFMSSHNERMFCVSTINERIKIVRKLNKLNQNDFANILGISQTHVSKIESGKDSPSKKLLKNICIEFNINPEWLEYESGDIKLSEFNEDIRDNECIVKTKKYLLKASKQEKLLYTNLLMQFPELIQNINLKSLENTDGYDEYVITTLNDTFSEILKYVGYLNTETLKIKNSSSKTNKIDEIFFISKTYVEKINSDLNYLADTMINRIRLDIYT